MLSRAASLHGTWEILPSGEPGTWDAMVTNPGPLVLPNGTALTIDLDIWKTMPGEAERACEEAQRDEHGVLAAWYVGFLHDSGRELELSRSLGIRVGCKGVLSQQLHSWSTAYLQLRSCC